MTEIKRMFSIIMRFSKMYMFMQAIAVLLKTASAMIVILLPKYIFELLVLKDERIWGLILFLLLLKLGVFTLLAFIGDFLAKKDLEFVDYFDGMLAKQCTDIEYSFLEDADVLNNFKMAQWGMGSVGSVSTVCGYLFGIITEIITVISIFAVFSILNVYIVLVIFACVVLRFYLQSRESKISIKDYGTGYNKYERLFGLYVPIMYDFQYGKDVRVYGIRNLFEKLFSKYIKDSCKFYLKTRSKIVIYRNLQVLVSALLMAVSYGYIFYLVFNGSISIASFMMYIIAMQTFTGSLSAVSALIVKIMSASKYLKYYFSFLDIKTQFGNEKIDKNSFPIIEFKNVSFKYPKTDDFILNNINIKINPHEKIAIVGANGAGKTTFIKLLLGLFQPTSGKILVNGVSGETLDINQYHDLFSVVFQDYKLLAATVHDNLCLSKTFSEDRLYSELEKVGLKQAIQNLPQKLNTYLFKYDGEEGLELSGGQGQRISIARSDLKNGSIVVLDEPTSALDPLAEGVIYKQFAEMAKDKAAIFISHRLAGCTLCDKIVVFDKGQIVETGTHDELSKQDTLYKSMFDKQAKFFNTGEAG